MSYLEHSGRLHKSGRYKDGSGNDPYQHCHLWLRKYNQYKNNGLSESEIAKMLISPNANSADLRARVMYYTEQEKNANRAEAIRLREDRQMSVKAIANQLGVSVGTVSNYLKPKMESDKKTIGLVVDLLKDECDNKPCIDIGKGSNNLVGCSSTMLKNAANILDDEGEYRKFKLHVEQPTNPGKWTTLLVMAKRDNSMTYDEQRKYLYNEHRRDIPTIGQWIEQREDGTEFVMGIKPPTPVNPKRVMVKYNEDGGSSKEGVVELRRGVEDIDLGESSYAQVRIKVGDKHYIKGMAVYGDDKDFPPGVDLIVNTNKSKKDHVMISDNKNESVLKLLKKDPTNPFGTYIKKGGQRIYVGKDGKDHQSALNIIREEGEWDDWSKTLASQFMSKQEPKLARQQLAKTYEEREREYKEILELTNPSLKQKMLMDLGGKCDTDAYELKCKGFRDTHANVILPLPSLKENECYAPRYKDGTRLVLVRYPHGGRFELPEVIVNNKNKEGSRVIGKTGIDAIGINAKTAEKLSGADFDGDTVWSIPNNSGRIKVEAAAEGLAGWDNKKAYPGYPGMKVMTHKQTQVEMGKVTNLITDMTQNKDATKEEIVRAIKHSMVVIDAEKHELNWRQSEIDNGILELKKKYQGGANAGASTFLSRVGADKNVPDIKRRVVDKETGEWKYIYSGKTYRKIKKDEDGTILSYGPEKLRMTTVPNLVKVQMEGGTARDLSSGSEIDEIYVEHSLRMTDLANRCRKTAVNMKSTEYDPNARKIYKEEYESLQAKIRNAELNQINERKATGYADTVIRMKERENPELLLKENKKERTKLRNMAMAEARAIYGASRKATEIHIEPKEWEAIQSGAITKTMTDTVFKYANMEEVMKYASPKQKKSSRLTNAQINKIKAELRSGKYTLSEIASDLGVSVSTIQEVKTEM